MGRCSFLTLSQLFYIPGALFIGPSEKGELSILHKKVDLLSFKFSTMEPPLRKKREAQQKKKDKGPIFASQKHVRIELENQWRHSKKSTLVPK